jgi:hypothetical protein
VAREYNLVAPEADCFFRTGPGWFHRAIRNQPGSGVFLPEIRTYFYTASVICAARCDSSVFSSKKLFNAGRIFVIDNIESCPGDGSWIKVKLELPVSTELAA